MARRASYAYPLPTTAIAQRPARPRDGAKLLVVQPGQQSTQDAHFTDLPRLLPPKAVLVLNDTKVEPARLQLRKPTGGRVEFLVVRQKGQIAFGLTNRPLQPGDVLQLGSYRLVVQQQADGQTFFRVPWAEKKLWSVLERFGQTPLPPYVKHSPLTEAARRKNYQSVFAQHPGSSAAPTASLHFTPRLLAGLERQGVDIAYVTLHVGLGTFAPLTAKQLQTGQLHAEHYEISAAAAARLNAAKSAGRPIIAVGTTVARALESAARRGRLIPGARTTTIFIRPGYRWQIVDGLITNFHVPESSLLMLVASLIGRETLFRLYRLALRRGYQFLSFGDGMFIQPGEKTKKNRSRRTGLTKK